MSTIQSLRCDYNHELTTSPVASLVSSSLHSSDSEIHHRRIPIDVVSALFWTLTAFRKDKNSAKASSILIICPQSHSTHCSYSLWHVLLPGLPIISSGGGIYRQLHHPSRSPSFFTISDTARATKFINVFRGAAARTRYRSRHPVYLCLASLR